MWKNGARHRSRQLKLSSYAFILNIQYFAQGMSFIPSAWLCMTGEVFGIKSPSLELFGIKCPSLEADQCHQTKHEGGEQFSNFVFSLVPHPTSSLWKLFMPSVQSSQHSYHRPVILSLLQDSSSGTSAQNIFVAAQLGIPDLLKDGPLSASEIALELGDSCLPGIFKPSSVLAWFPTKTYAMVENVMFRHPHLRKAQNLDSSLISSDHVPSEAP